MVSTFKKFSFTEFSDAKKKQAKIKRMFGFKPSIFEETKRHPFFGPKAKKKKKFVVIRGAGMSRIDKL